VETNHEFEEKHLVASRYTLNNDDIQALDLLELEALDNFGLPADVQLTKRQKQKREILMSNVIELDDTNKDELRHSLDDNDKLAAQRR